MRWDGIVTVTLDARVEDKHKAGVWGKLLHPLLSLVWYQLGSVPSGKGAALRVGWAQVSRCHLDPSSGCFGAALKCWG